MKTLNYENLILVIVLPPFDHGASYAEDAWDIYWFEKNLQGDIIAVYDQAGNKLIAYKYDAWGNTTINYYNSGDSTTAVNNPFRYRGYYYDQDLELYYLNTRYYDSKTGRFINADGYVSTGQGLLGYNMYAYCGNNPVIGIDPTGKWTVSIGGNASAVCVAGVSYGIAFSLDDDGNLGIQFTESNVIKKKSGLMLGGINAGINTKIAFSNNSDTIYDLEGESFSLSGSVGKFGIETATSDLNNMSEGVNTFALTYGYSLAPVDVAATASKTETLWSFNIVKTIKKAWRGVVSWLK